MFDEHRSASNLLLRHVISSVEQRTWVIMSRFAELELAHICSKTKKNSLFLFLFLLFAGGGQAQNPNVSTPVLGSGHDYIQDLNEIVDPTTGSLSIRIGTANPHDRGVNPPFYAFIYDTNGLFEVAPSYISGLDETTVDLTFTQSPYQFSGIAGNTNAIYSQIQSIVSPPNSPTTYDCSYYNNYVYVDPQGGRHAFPHLSFVVGGGGGLGSCPVNTVYFDGDDYYQATIGNNGVVYVFDNNGNLMQTQQNQGGGVLITEDTNGNFLNGTGRVYGTQTTKGAVTSATFPAQNGTYTYTTTSKTTPMSFAPTVERVIQPPSSGGATWQCGPLNALPTGYVSSSSITLPDGQSYQFTYDPVYGVINQIVYPTGATVNYTWSTIPQMQSYTDVKEPCEYIYNWMAITKRVVSYDGVTPAQEQDFSYPPPTYSTGTWPQKTQAVTTVVTKDLLRTGKPSFTTTYTTSYVSQAGLTYTVPAISTIAYYDFGGSLLKTVMKVWSVYSEGVSLPDVELLGAECTTLPNGQTSGTFYQYLPLPGASYYAESGGASNIPTDVAEYDYGKVTSSCTQPTTTPTRETKTAYQTFPALPTVPAPLPGGNAVILGHPCSVITYGNGTKLSETDYLYDGGTAVCGTPGTPSVTAVSKALAHDETNYGPTSTVARGNATTITKKCFVGSTACVDSSTHYTYDETGQVVSSTDADGNPPTTYSYADNYSSNDGSPPGNTNTYLTKVTRPSTNGVAHVTSYSYGYNDGKVRSITDENLKVTTYCYFTGGCSGNTEDPWERATEVDYPDGGNGKASYSDAGPNPSTTTTTAINGNLTQTSTAVFDAYGHAIKALLTSDPCGTDEVDTQYDGLGRAYTVSNPYHTTNPCNQPTTTNGTTTYTYDALGRKVTQANPDGNTFFYWCYNGVASDTQPNCVANASSYTTDAWVDTTDENGNHQQQVSDGLGRLLAVMEPDPASGTLSLQTQYTYDALNNLLSVNQLGTSTDTPRKRGFTYDSLSRLVTSANPETGTISYSYDANGNLKLKTDARGVATNYSYDALNRLTSKTYSGLPASVANTPSSTFVYDTNGTTVTNGIGRLVAEYTGSSSSPTTQRSIVAYDAMGRVSQEQQCGATALCGTAPYTFQYMYDLAGDMAYSNNGLSSTGIGLTYTYDGAGRLQGMSSTWDDATHPSTLFAPPASGGQYSAAGNLVAAGFGMPSSSSLPDYTLLRAYDNRLRTISETDTGTNAVTTPATGSMGSIGVSGKELVIGSTPSTGTITITGAPGSYQVCISAGGITNCPSLVFTPNTYVLINGPAGRFTAMASSAAGTTAAGVASTLTTALNASGSPVTATVNGSVITLTSNATGSSSDYMTYVSNLNESGPGGTALAGGAGGASTPSTGTVTITGAPGSYQVCISAGGITNCPSLVFTPNTYVLINGPAGRFTALASSAAGTTAAGVASTLTTALNASGSPVTATVNGSVITLTSNATGSSSDYMVYVSNLNESGPGGTALAGGAAGVPTYDTGTVTVTINGVTASYAWGSSATQTTVASGLQAAINQADSSFLGATVSGTTVNLASTQTGASTNWAISCTVTDSNNTLFPTPSFAEVCNGMTGGANPVTGGTATLYNYALSYYPNSNLQTVNDSVMGNWTYKYDNLNRLQQANASATTTGFAPYGTAQLNWSYDSFGNYEGQTLTGNTTAIVNQGTYSYPQPNNQIEGDCYDASGNLLIVGGACPTGTTTYTYIYDAEGRLAATGTTQYVYDAEGRRVAKLNNGTLTNLYLLGLGGEQVTELNTTTGSLAWAHSNVYASGKLLATYDSKGLHFHFADWVGSRRVQASVNSGVDETCQSLPFGDSLNCSGPGADATEHHFTGKERDTESGLDYFGARYMSGNLGMGRFMSPDPVFISAQRLADPQSLNLYAYVRNNPLGLTDDTGLDFYLACATSDHSGCGQVQNGSSSVWVQGQTVNGSFQATDVDMNKQGDTSAGYHDQFGNQYSGTFDQNNGVSFTNSATGATSGHSQFIDGSDNTQLSGSGAFSNITGNFFSDCGGSCQGRASLSGTADAFAATEAQLNKQGGLTTALDRLSGAHKGGAQWKDSNGYVHMLQSPSGQMEMHFEGHPTGVDVQQFVLHMVDTIRDATSGRANQEKNATLPQ